MGEISKSKGEIDVRDIVSRQRLQAQEELDLQGRVIANRMVCDAYAFEDGLIKSMEIKEPTGA